MGNIHEGMRFKTISTIFKFKDPTGKIGEAIHNGMPVEEAVKKYSDAFIEKEQHIGNLALNAGITALLNCITGISVAIQWSAGVASIGVGESATGAVATQTNLLGSTKTYKGMDANFPSVANQTATWQATFATGDANIAWNEYVVNSTVAGDGTSLNRVVTSKGTKASGETWTLQIQITPA
jgi:hypothetical protein